MKKSPKGNYAFIDSQNVNLAIKAQGWKLDWGRFRVYLRDKYHVTQVYLFIGYVEGNNELYIRLQKAGFICIFKPTLTYKDGTTKGNCDAELVLHAMIQLPNFDKAVIVTGDGDFYCLVQHLIEIEKFERLLIPNMNSYSALLKKFAKKDLAFMNDLHEKLAYKKRTL